MAERAFQLFFADQAAEGELYPQLLEVEVEAEADRADTFRIKIALRVQADGGWGALDDERFALFTKVRVEAGFADGNTEVLTEGYITDVRAHFEDPSGQPFLVLSGLDASALMSLEEKIAAWPNLSDSDIATQILSSYGFTPDVTGTATVHQEADVTVMQRGTDLQFLRRLARKHGFEVGVERDAATGQVTGYFRPPALDGTPQPALAVAFGASSSLKSFDVRVSGLRPLDVATAQIDVKARAESTGAAGSMQLSPIGAQELDALVSGPLGALVSPKEALGKLWLHASPTSDSAELADMAQAVRDEAAWLVSASGEIISDVYGRVLRAGRLVLVRGAGERYSGKYYVTRVVHRMAGDGAYEQTFHARRNALGVDGSEDFGGGDA